jgi:hypothetical protein
MTSTEAGEINPNNTTNMNKEEIAKYIYNYAQEHYDDGGWDVIVECWTIQAIMDALEDDETKEEALESFRSVAEVHAERQADAINSVW